MKISRSLQLRFYLLIAISFLAIAPVSLHSFSRVPETIVKVGFLTEVDRIQVKNYVKIKAVDISTGEKKFLSPGKNYVFQKGREGLKFGEFQLGNLVRLIPVQDTEFIRINGRRYRDNIIIQQNDDGTLTAINELGVDGYLFGVLPVEVSPNWPIESLKAQAVVSRTFVMNNIDKYAHKGYGLSADVFSQVFRGGEVENPTTNRAVKETSGEVLSYNADLARGYFFSSCGGYTADVKNVWGSGIPYMEGVTCGYCKDSPRYRWNKTVSPENLKMKLNSDGYNIGEIEDIKFLSRTSSGRIDEMLIIHSLGRTALTGHSFRMVIGPDIIKSTLMSLDRDKPEFSFYGRGWGHGVGMCQWGAKGMAEKGYNYRKILKFYFPEIRVEKLTY